VHHPNTRPAAVAVQAALLKRNNLAFLGTGDAPMVFCHGFGTDQGLWRLLAPRFMSSHRVVLLDHVGSGHSDASAYRTAKYATLDGYVEDLLEVCAAFDLRNVIFVGHSVAAMIGLRAHLREPDRFNCLIMLGASPRYLDDADYRGGFTQADVDELLTGFDLNREAWAHHLANATLADPGRPALAAELEAHFLHAEPSILRRFARTTFAVDDRALLASCDLPVLLLQSRMDPIVPETASLYLAGHLPQAELAFLETAGHFAQLTDPDAVEGRMRTFLEAREHA